MSEATIIDGVLTERTMSARMRKRWERKYCTERDSYLWGQKRLVTPVLIPVVFGDGKQALAIRPIATRLSHYVLAIDSTIKVEGGGVHDFIDQFYDAIEGRFGSCCCENCNGEFENVEVFEEWPIPCLNTGSEWWRL
jgi:hypothetical protein